MSVSHEALVEFYHQHDPSKTDIEIEQILKNYEGNQAGLLEGLREKYGSAPSAASRATMSARSVGSSRELSSADLERQLSNPYDDLPKVLDEMEKEDQLGSYTEDEQLCKGRLGEAVIISKAEGVERVGIMIALLLSVTWGFMQGVDEELQKSFSTNYRYEIYHGAIVLSNGAGLFSLLLLVFLCIKIRRLSAKSMFCYSGIGGTAELKYDYLVKVHSKGMIDNLLREASKNENAAGMKNKNDTRFFARQWYNDQTKLINGRQLYLAGLTGFILQLTTFVIATSIKLGDTGRTALPTLHAVNMAWPPAIAMGMLCAASTFSELL